MRLTESLPQADDDAPGLGIEAQDMERPGKRPRRLNAETLPLANREMRDPVMTAEHPAALVDDVAGFAGFGAQALDEIGIGALRYETDILAVRLFGDRQGEVARQCPRLILCDRPERKAQKIEFGAGRAVEKIALVARGVAG